MGNTNVTYAKSSEPTPGSFQAPPLTAPLPPQSVGEKTNTSAPAPPVTSAAPVDKKLTNPGLFEELHKKAKEVHPQPLDGFRLVSTKDSAIISKLHIHLIFQMRQMEQIIILVQHMWVVNKLVQMMQLLSYLVISTTVEA